MKVGPEPFYVRECKFPEGLTNITETFFFFFFLYFIVFICKFYKEQAKRYYNASLNTFYIIKGCTHTQKRQRVKIKIKIKIPEGGKEAYCVLNSYLSFNITKSKTRLAEAR